MKLKHVLSVENNKVWERHLRYHERTKQVLKAQNLQVQAHIGELSSYAETKQMRINQKKSIVTLFNTYLKNTFALN